MKMSIVVFLVASCRLLLEEVARVSKELPEIDLGPPLRLYGIRTQELTIDYGRLPQISGSNNGQEIVCSSGTFVIFLRYILG